MTTPEHTVRTGIPILDRAAKAFNDHDLAALVRLWTEDAVIQVPGGAPLRGGTGWAAYQEMLFRACPDAWMEIHFAGQVGNAVIQEGTMHGTHTGDLTLPDGVVRKASGKSISVHYVEIFWVDDTGHVERVHLYSDRLDLYEKFQ